MVNISVIKGGLGNQMFCYAFYLALRKEKPFSLSLIDIEETVNKHFGLEIFKIFHCKGLWRYKTFCFLHKIHPYFWKQYINITQEDGLKYDEKYLIKKNTNVYYNGYWQSENYFEKVSNTVRKHFRFKKTLLNTTTKEFARIIKTTNSVSIHIRRGDYLKEQGWDTCDLDYYFRAIDYVKNNITNCNFFIFSDDIDWCKEHFGDNEFSYIDWNKGYDSWQDMYLMSLCKHNIIANSTFSWWGAWLNNNPDKYVIAPSIWFKDRENNVCHIVPDKWVKL